jgi:redox-sensitive bicupin YhaK (pirin superfamily)
MGTKAIIRPGEVQRMSAGSGVRHSEYNALKDQETHFFQIWILPNAPGGTPGYGQKSFEPELNSKKLVLVVSQDAREGSIGIKQDADMYISRLAAGDKLEYRPRAERGVWLQVVRGALSVNGEKLGGGDALSFENEENLRIEASEKSEFFLFDLA